MKFWNFVEKGEDIELRIEGDIVDDSEAWIYEWFGEKATSPNNFREELNKHKGKNITVWIDSYGGNVFAGAGIYNALKNHQGKVIAKIDGKAMSIASVIAMAADEVQVSPVGVIMIHNPWSMASGDMHDLRKTADVLDTIKESIVNAYVLKTGKSESEIAIMMDEETWMSANVAVKQGFADAVISETIEALNESKGIAFNRLEVMNKTDQAIKKLFDLERSKNALNNAKLKLMVMKGEQNEKK
jgi:ATP-dependent Clp protease protease subunit